MNMAVRTGRLIYLHYLDYFAKDIRKNSDSYKAKRFAFDILSYPNAHFLIAAPAIAKCVFTTRVMLLCDSLWKNGRISYVLSPEYAGDVGNYMTARRRKLEAAFDEDALRSHYEWKGYTSSRFAEFDRFTACYGETRRHDRVQDADEVFRRIVSEFADDYLPDILAISAQAAGKTTRVLQDLCTDRTRLFQREIAIETISSHVADRSSIRLAGIHLDYQFARANAISASAHLPREFDEVDGVILEKLVADMRVDFGTTFPSAVMRMPWEGLLAFSQTEGWRCFLGTISNAYLWTIGELHLSQNEAMDCVRKIAGKLYFVRLATHMIACAIVKKALAFVGDEALLAVGFEGAARVGELLVATQPLSRLPSWARDMAANKAWSNTSERGARFLASKVAPVLTNTLEGAIEAAVSELLPIVGPEIIRLWGAAMIGAYKELVVDVRSFAEGPYDGLPYFVDLQRSMVLERGLHSLR